MSKVKELAKSVQGAAAELAVLTAERKNSALLRTADALERDKEKILSANLKDVEKAEKDGMSPPLVDRLTINEKRFGSIVESIKKVVSLEDPIGRVDSGWSLPNGLKVNRVRVPLGAIAMVYEGRPNVTIEAFSLCLKSGNSVLLKGSSSALDTNRELVGSIKKALKGSGFPSGAVELIEETSHEAVGEMIKLDEYLDLVIPRGGSGLIDYVVKNSTVPTLETGTGNCHIFVDQSADFGMALDIIENAKTQRPGTCNAVEKVLVHESIARGFEPLLYERLSGAGVEIRGCEESLKIVPGMIPATPEDWQTEYLDLILGVKVVSNLDEAIGHIRKYGTKHSESIITRDYGNAMKFTSEIDAAAVYVNASTRFTDGSQFGFGAEIGISTQKMHARGPVGLNELTTYKYVIFGEGQTRK